MDQETTFLRGEGDKYFRRNRNYFTSPKPNDFPLYLLETFKIVPKKMLEVGASNGFRLAAIADKYGATYFGIDPSEEAVRDGSQRFPSIRLKRGVASVIPFEDEEFDLVVINFVFHWIDRAKLLKCAAEIDRVLQWDGFLVVGDFLPPSPCKVKYHHLPSANVWTYKQNYSELFTGSGLYHIVGLVTGNHRNNEISAEVSPQDRIGAFLLQKRMRYVEARLDSETERENHND